MSVRSPVGIVTSPAITNSFFQDSSNYKCNGYSSPKEVPINQHVLNVTDGPLRKRSESTGDTIERLSLMDIDQDETVLDRPARVLSPPIRSETICIPQHHSRSHSLTPEPTMSRTPNLPRHLFRRGKTIDTSSITKEEHEDYSLVNQYKVLDIIGHGSFGIVHKATNSENGDTYAMKIVGKRRLIKKRFPMRRPKPGGGRGPMPDPLADIRKEIAILKKLDHPNVVKLVEVLDDPSEDDLVLVFEYIANGAVMPEITPENRISEERARDYFIDLILGLEYLHSQKVIHRDIKPENLLLDESDVLRIADFGVSEQWSSDASDAQLHKTAGTPAFAAPETLDTSHQVFGGKALDIWAAGVTLYCFIYGKVPFTARGIPELYEKIRTQEVKLLDFPEISYDLKDLLLRLLNQQPDDRITIPEIRRHPWFTNTSRPIPTTQKNCQCVINVSEEEIEEAVQKIRTPIHILVMLKRMAKQKSLRNPYPHGISNSPSVSPVVSPSRERRSSQQEKQSNFAKMKSIPIISISSDTEMITDDGSLSPR